MNSYDYKVDNIPLLTSDRGYNITAPSKLESKMNKLEDGIAEHIYVTSNKRRLFGAAIILISIIGFILMAVTAEGVCPKNLSIVLCFGIYTVLSIIFLAGVFFACGLIGLFGSIFCCDICAQCGQLFVCCMFASDEL